MELLAPCGNYKSLIGVINAGADAVYLAGNKYGARAYADNFSDEEVIKAIHYAHLFNVKVYLTVNTLIKESEFNDVIEYINVFYQSGLDACIVQDIGLISLFKSHFPNMECHISTQAFSTGINSVKMFKELGAERVVLARELSLNEIKTIKKECNIEIETFIHGAMCYSYSGQCLFSSCLGGRSGNRGRCAGPCRLNYSYNNKDGYLLSMKDQCVLEILPDLINAGIDSFKIEGRMKKPEYAAFVTSIYRKYIDMYTSDPSKFKIDKQDIISLNNFYMRSEIGTGYYYEKNGSDMLCISNPAYEKTDEQLIKYISEKYLKSEKKAPVDIYIDCHVGNKFQLTLVYKDNYSVTVSGVNVEEGLKRPLTKEDIIKQVSKLGETWFYAGNVYVNMSDNSFYSLKAINELRREACDQLLNDILRIDSRENNEANVINVNFKNERTVNPLINVSTVSQLREVVACVSSEVNISINDDILEDSLEVINDNNNCNYYINLPFVTRKDTLYLLNKYNNLSNSYNLGLIINNQEELYYYRNNRNKKILGPGLYTWNKSSLNYYLKYCDEIIYSYELSQREINNLNYNNGYWLVYGRIPLMQTANCLEKTTAGCKKNQGPSFTELRDRKNASFLIKRNCTSCYNTIYNSVPTSLHNDNVLNIINENIFINFTDETELQVRDIINLFINKSGSKIPESFTRGYIKRGVE